MILVTGAAGFIGFHVSEALLARGDLVLGIDNLSSYYDVTLKEARLARLEPIRISSSGKSTFPTVRRCRNCRMPSRTSRASSISRAGRRAPLLTDPYVYVQANVMGQVVMLELARTCPKHHHFVYASSRSVYGGNDKLPFSVDDPVTQPEFTLRRDEARRRVDRPHYAHLYGVPSTGLRFFTVYGPWGRPTWRVHLHARDPDRRTDPASSTAARCGATSPISTTS